MNKLYFLLNFIFIFILVACSNIDSTDNINSRVSFQDNRDKTITLNSTPRRIIGLAPSITEILYAIVPDSLIVGRTQNCNYPLICFKKPIVNNYPLDFEKLISLKPDIVFVQEGMTPQKDIFRMEELGLNVFYLKLNTTEQLLGNIAKIGKITHNSANSDYLVKKYTEIINELKNDRSEIKTPKIMALASYSPIYVFGLNSLFTEKIQIAGGKNAVLDTFSNPFPELTREYVLKCNPDAFIGADFNKMDTTFFTLYPELKQTNAYKTKSCFDVDNDLMTRPSPRILQSIYELKAIVDSINKL